jgi:hypothetical protein
MGSIWAEIPGQGWKACAVPNTTAPGRAAPPAEGIGWLAFRAGAEAGVALLVRTGVLVRVNGQPVVAGLRLLEHQDEILVRGARFFFSAESTPVQVAFRLEAGARAPTCPVCRGAIWDGDQAVQCPGCTRWFHQLDAAGTRRAKHCWTYAARCRFCNHPTSLSGEPGWTPETEQSNG